MAKLLAAVLALIAFASTAQALLKTAYFVNWAIYGRNHNLYNIPMEKLDLLVYAFVSVQGATCVLTDPWSDTDKPGPADCTANGAVQNYADPLKGNFYQLQCLKKKYPNLKVVFSVGGWTLSKNFDFILPYPTLYPVLAKSCADLMNKYGFDGIDIDFEYPCKVKGEDCGERPNAPVVADEPNAFSDLMDAFRAAIGPNKILAAAFNADPRKLKENYNIPRLDKVLNHYFMMTYDFTSGSWGDNFTGHHSNLGNNSADPLTRRRQWSGATAIDAVVSLGATPSKVNLGVAFYGRGFKVDTTAMNKQATLPGLYAPSTGASNIETYTEKNVFDFKSLMTTYYKPQNEYWDPVAKSHYSFDPATGNFMTYDSVAAVQEKVKFAMQRKIEGVFAWETSGDYQNMLMNAMNYIPPAIDPPAPSNSTAPIAPQASASSSPATVAPSASSSPAGSPAAPSPAASSPAGAASPSSPAARPSASASSLPLCIPNPSNGGSAGNNNSNNNGPTSAGNLGGDSQTGGMFNVADMNNMWLQGFGVGIAVGIIAVAILSVIGFFVYRAKVVRPLQKELSQGASSSKANLNSSMTSLGDSNAYTFGTVNSMDMASRR